MVSKINVDIDAGSAETISVVYLKALFKELLKETGLHVGECPPNRLVDHLEAAGGLTSVHTLLKYAMSKSDYEAFIKSLSVQVP